MSEWTKDGNQWKHGEVLLEYDPDEPIDTWRARRGARRGYWCGSAIEALDMLARYLAEDWKAAAAVAEVRAARDAWPVIGHLTIEEQPSVLSVVDDSGVTLADLPRRIENLEEALADALATIAELQREIREIRAREGL